MGTWLSKSKLTIKGLEADEAKFAKTLKGADGRVFKKGQSEIDGVTRLETDHHSYYYKKEFPKDQIVLHYTVGYLSGDVCTLSRKDMHVSTAYVVGRSGGVYELFDPKYWSYHLGPKSTGGNRNRSQRTIGIEISNFGPLKEHRTKPNILLDSYGFPYCMKSDTDFYVKSLYRGNLYYCTFTDAQYKALDSLLLKLCRKFDIVHSFPPKDKRLEHYNVVPTKGIVSHVNYRSDKVDLSPAFDWSRISGR